MSKRKRKLGWEMKIRKVGEKNIMETGKEREKDRKK